MPAYLATYRVRGQGRRWLQIFEACIHEAEREAVRRIKYPLFDIARLRDSVDEHYRNRRECERT